MTKQELSRLLHLTDEEREALQRRRDEWRANMRKRVLAIQKRVLARLRTQKIALEP